MTVTSVPQQEAAGHTPGPWALEPTRPPSDAWLLFARAGARRVISVIATINNWADGDPPDLVEAQANARLIAASPELLAACEAWQEADAAYANCDACASERFDGGRCPKHAAQLEAAEARRDDALRPKGVQS